MLLDTLLGTVLPARRSCMEGRIAPLPNRCERVRSMTPHTLNRMVVPKNTLSGWAHGLEAQTGNPSRKIGGTGRYCNPAHSGFDMHIRNGQGTVRGVVLGLLRRQTWKLSSWPASSSLALPRVYTGSAACKVRQCLDATRSMYGAYA